MNVLLAVASKHGSTRGIAEAIAEALHEQGISADVHGVDSAPPLEQFDGVILGSAVYMGKWLPEARRFVELRSDTLRTLPVWLFSSGPLGQDDPQPAGDPEEIGNLMEATGARGHQTFVGKLDRNQLGLGERIIVRVVKAPEGDFRDWTAIRDWAHDIANELRAPAAVPILNSK